MKETDLSRRGINELKAYVPGKPAEEVKREYGLSDIIKLASNENPLGPSTQAVDAMKEAILESHLYPEGSCALLRKKLAATLEIEDDMIIFGNGADNTLTMIAQAFINEGDEAILGNPSFSAYDTVTKIMGGKAIKVPLDDFAYDLPAIAKKITSKTKLIFVCNPNNPTGTIVTKEEVEDFMELVPPHCIVVFDEAYYEFVERKDYPQALEYVRAGKNVLITRTFSKIYGLAGLRIGYALGPATLIDTVAKVKEPFAVNRIAQAGAMAAFDDTNFVEQVLELTAREKQYLYSEFLHLKMPYVQSHTNFIYVDLGMDTQQVFKKLLAKGIVIRPANMWNMPTFARITIGTHLQNEKLIKALTEIKKTTLK